MNTKLTYTPSNIKEIISEIYGKDVSKIAGGQWYYMSKLKREFTSQSTKGNTEVFANGSGQQFTAVRGEVKDIQVKVTPKEVIKIAPKEAITGLAPKEVASKLGMTAKKLRRLLRKEGYPRDSKRYSISPQMVKKLTEQAS